MINVFAETAEEMRGAVLRCLSDEGADIYISAAAISDFRPEKVPGKIPSGKAVALRLEPLNKLLSEVLEDYHPLTIAFKLGNKPEKMAKAMIRQGVAMVLMNTPESMGGSRGDYVLLTKDEKIPLRGTKDEISQALWKAVIR